MTEVLLQRLIDSVEMATYWLRAFVVVAIFTMLVSFIAGIVKVSNED